ncbi:mitochondrial import receptor subunit TOM40 homolog 1-like [Drosophila hydei]|uniref:Mitochondrial import receptor subunit TOM40 homolog 1-like n=1 Tax=Drosophila hydei TaxID=7224 RepID=A0A6J1L8R5_DROHY|nr:mitochondrial import receptor subunit TOM40 homolog 1-like [Drosophila hydei]XP_023160683.2 mitochondrial import receptor subunit TOM40 homolog 1-like [Drosophila hydei]XP_023160765.2 mitochondrial import receptor subunit TOM40 homolog 1-like [Drosophila hydei]
MGNVHPQQPEHVDPVQSNMDKDKFYRFFGLRMANEGDGYDITEQRRLEIHLEQKQHDNLDDYGKPSSGAVNRSTVIPWLGGLKFVERLGNPGTVAELHRRCHDMMPQTFDGFRLNVSRALGNYLTVGHSLHAGNRPQTIDCQFNCSYQGDQVHELSGESYPLLIGEMDARGNITANLMHFITPCWRTKLTATILDSVVQNSRLFIDYFGEDYTCTCVLSNIDVMQSMGVFVASYLQQVTAQLALGVDVIYQREDIVPGGQAALVSAVARYQQDNRQWSAMLSLHALELCYTQIYGESLGASVQLQANILKRQAISRLCYHCHMPRVGFSFRGGIDTRGVISAVCEKRLDPLPILLQISGKMNHFSSRFRFGLGLILG